MCLNCFLIRRVATGVKFDLRSPNGEVIATSEVYRSEAACRRGIQSVQKNACLAPEVDLTAKESAPSPKFEIYQDRRGDFRFRLLARNGKIIATSEGYTSKQACCDGIRAVRQCARPEPEI